MQQSSRPSRRSGKRQLISAATESHRSWFATCARTGLGHVWQQGGLIWTHPGDGGGDGHVAFPDLVASFSGETANALLHDYRRTKPFVNIMCWAATPSKELDVRLVARGFEKSWQPHWMAADLTTIPDTEPPPSVTLEQAQNVPASAWTEAFRTIYDMPSPTRPQPNHYVALQANEVIGQGTFHLTDQSLNVAGVYNVEVDPAFRRRGIGWALMALVLREARGRGARYAVLNSTPAGEPLYRKLGFRSLGWGQTWFLRAELLRAPPATTLQVELAEAVIGGDVVMLERQAAQLTTTMLASPLPCGATPFELAVQFSRNRAARWLASHGALVDAISLWDLGWRQEVKRLLQDHPKRANFRSGSEQKTPLHVAAERNDLDLAAVVLAARPDLTATDAVFMATPLAWAEHLGHHDLAQLLRRYGATT